MAGETWSREQSAALGQGDESFAESCTAALQRCALVSEEVERLLDYRQRRVVGHACSLAHHRIGRSVGKLVDGERGEGEGGGDLDQR